MSIKSIILAVAVTVAIGGSAMAQSAGNGGGGGGGGGGDGNPSDPGRTPIVTSPIAKKLPINQNPNGGGKQATNDPSGVPCAMTAVGGRQRCDRPGRWIYVE